jgi:hypothetical protein
MPGFTEGVGFTALRARGLANDPFARFAPHPPVARLEPTLRVGSNVQASRSTSGPTTWTVLISRREWDSRRLRARGLASQLSRRFAPAAPVARLEPTLRVGSNVQASRSTSGPTTWTVLISRREWDSRRFAPVASRVSSHGASRLPPLSLGSNPRSAWARTCRLREAHPAPLPGPFSFHGGSGIRTHAGISAQRLSRAPP